MVFSYSHSVLLPFYICKILFILPLEVYKSPDEKWHIFQISFTSVIGVIFLMYGTLYYANTLFVQSTSCKTNNNCSSVILGMIEGLYSFSLLFTILVIKRTETVELFNHLNEIVNSGKHILDQFKIQVFCKIRIFYIFVLLQFLRNCFFDENEIFVNWALKVITQNVQYAIDGVVVSFSFVLAASFKEMVYDLYSDDYIRENIAIYWNRKSILRKLDVCYGPVLVVIVIFKLLQISGLIYFYLISDFKNHWLQSLDIGLPLMNSIWLCYSCDLAVSEAQNFVKELRLMLKEKNRSLAIKEEIQEFIYINKFKALSITGCNFFTVDMTLLFKIASVIFTYIVAIVQF